MKKSIPRVVQLLCTLTAALTLGLICPQASTLLVDFGDNANPSGGTAGAAVTWNDIPTGVAASDFGELFDLVTTNGTPTTIGLRMLSRFNGANESGTTASTRFPGSATRDSFFGNTESFGNLENITPRFQITGLNPGEAYDFVFYASRTGASDNRETRYTVTGANEKSTDLNASNNVDNVATVTGVEADAAGEITIALTPGPNNDNANHFTYLGVLAVQSVANPSVRLLFDFGPANAATGEVRPDPGIQWNNVTTTVGSTSDGAIESLVTTNGTATGYSLRMISRFNAANTAGSTAATVFPASATRDSLYGNTEAFNGLSQVMPEFKLVGLNSAALYRFTFYASRTGSSDNRETRYTVTGANSKFGDLNAANNIDGTVTIEGIQPDEAGEIRIRLNPGPNNNNANHFTYLGALRVEWALPARPTLLVDFGAAATPTLFGVDDLDNHWNNVDPTVGGSSTGVLTNLVGASGTPTGFSLEMVSRFNGANANGTTAVTPFPVKATQDSLFGNTETFSGLADVTPIFKLTGLPGASPFNFSFFASRMGVGDNRETRYIVEGSNSGSADLNASNNELETVRVEGIRPDASGAITIRLEPGPNNDNGNHFTYLGVMRVEWTPATEVVLSEPTLAGDRFTFRLRGAPGKTYRVQSSVDLSDWTEAATVTLTTDSTTADVPASGDARFFQVRE